MYFCYNRNIGMRCPPPLFRGWVCYDRSCRLCLRWVRLTRGSLSEKGFELIPLQTPWVRAKLREQGESLLKEVRVIRADGAIHGGAEGLLHLAQHYWWGGPICQAARLGWCRTLLKAGYAWVARNRHCVGGQCEVGERRKRPHRLETFYDLEGC